MSKQPQQKQKGDNTVLPSNYTMARGKGKRGGSKGYGRRFAAESAEEIEQRNQRLAAFDAERNRRRAEAAEEEGGGGTDGAAKGKAGDDEFDPDVADAEREAMLVGMRVAKMSTEDEDEEEGSSYQAKERKKKGLEGIIEIENPNLAGTNPRMLKAKDLESTEAVPLTRREREEKEKAAAAAAYRKRHEAGLTEEYKRDMAKLAEVRARREAAEAKAKLEREAAEAAEAERKKQAEAVGALDSDDDDDDGKKKKKSSKKKSGKDDIPKLDKIAIKKMKPAQMKEALKVRGLDIQGNAKQLMERLIAYEKDR